MSKHHTQGFVVPKDLQRCQRILRKIYQSANLGLLFSWKACKPVNPPEKLICTVKCALDDTENSSILFSFAQTTAFQLTVFQPLTDYAAILNY